MIESELYFAMILFTSFYTLFYFHNKYNILCCMTYNKNTQLILNENINCVII
nr:hypothetical protein YSBCXYJI_YSBCXYJI_CDS_0038 [Caudoviricetes sp.]